MRSRQAAVGVCSEAAHGYLPPPMSITDSSAGPLSAPDVPARAGTAHRLGFAVKVLGERGLAGAGGRVLVPAA